MYRMLYCWVFEVTGESLKQEDPQVSNEVKEQQLLQVLSGAKRLATHASFER